VLAASPDGKVLPVVLYEPLDRVVNGSQRSGDQTRECAMRKLMRICVVHLFVARAGMKTAETGGSVP
jgi:hypothetical protein